MIRLKSYFFSFVFFLTLFTFFFIQKVNAQSYRGMVLDQYRFDISNVKPGDVITKTFVVTDDYRPEEDGKEKQVKLFLKSRNFTQGDVQGVPSFYEDGALPSEVSLADWITFSEDYILLTKNGEMKTVKFTIRVPENATPGGKYAAVLLANRSGNESLESIEQESIEQDSTSGTGLNAEVGPLIFLTVAGDTTSNLEVEKIFTANIKRKETSFFFNPPINVVVRLKNTGNIHVVPQGKVYIHRGKNMLENPVAIFDFNGDDVDPNMILPGTSRDFVFTWSRPSLIETVAKLVSGEGEPEKYDYSTEYNLNEIKDLRIGSYTASVLFDYKDAEGVRSNSFTLTTDFRVFPWQLIVLILIMLLVIISVLYTLKKVIFKRK